MAEWFWTTWWYWYQHRDEEQLRKIDEHPLSEFLGREICFGAAGRSGQLEPSEWYESRPA